MFYVKNVAKRHVPNANKQVTEKSRAPRTKWKSTANGAHKEKFTDAQNANVK